MTQSWDLVGGVQIRFCARRTCSSLWFVSSTIVIGDGGVDVLLVGRLGARRRRERRRASAATMIGGSDRTRCGARRGSSRSTPAGPAPGLSTSQGLAKRRRAEPGGVGLVSAAPSAVPQPPGGPGGKLSLSDRSVRRPRFALLSALVSIPGRAALRREPQAWQAPVVTTVVPPAFDPVCGGRGPAMSASPGQTGRCVPAPGRTPLRHIAGVPQFAVLADPEYPTEYPGSSPAVAPRVRVLLSSPSPRLDVCATYISPPQ